MEKQPECVRRFLSAKEEWVREGRGKAGAQLGNVAITKVKLL